MLCCVFCFLSNIQKFKKNQIKIKQTKTSSKTTNTQKHTNKQKKKTNHTLNIQHFKNKFFLFYINTLTVTNLTTLADLLARAPEPKDDNTNLRVPIWGRRFCIFL